MPAKSQDLNLVDGLFQLSFRLQSTLARIAAEHELSTIQVRLLGILRDREPGMLELARYLELEKSSLSGLVERIASPDDGRAFNLRVTAQGRKLSRVVEDEVNAEVATLVSVLAKADRERLTGLLAQIVAGVSG